MRREELLAVWFALKRRADRARCLNGETARSVIRSALGTATDPEQIARALEVRGALRRARPEETGDHEVWMMGSEALFEESGAVFGDNDCNVMNDEVAA